MSTNNNADFTATFLVPQSPEAVFEKVSNVRQWWSGIFGEEITDEPGGFSFRAGGGAHYSKQKLVDAVPGRKLVWEVTDSQLSFLEGEQEWTGTRFGFELLPEGTGTRVIFTHSGLVPQLECYDQCSGGWSRYLQERLLPLLHQHPAAA